MAVVTFDTPTSWADAFAAANFNALANNGGILSTATAINNSSTKDFWCELSFICVTSTWAVSAGGHLAFYLLPLLHDGSTYPSSNNGTASTDYPGGQYWVGNIGFRAATIAHTGSTKPFLIPPGTFKFYVVNRTGAALPSSATNMTCQYRMYGELIT